MADLIPIVSTAIAVTNVIDAVRSTIEGVQEIIARRKKVDSKSALKFAEPLISLRDELVKIKEWAEADDIGDPCYQLVMDLDRLMSCSKILLKRIDLLLSELYPTETKSPRFSSRLNRFLENREISHFQNLIKQQTEVCTLLLTACNSKSISIERRILERKGTRRALQQVKVNVAALVNYSDTSSSFSQWTTNLSKISKPLSFQRGLLLPSFSRQIIRDFIQQAQRYKRGDNADRRRSKAIDRYLEEDCEKKRRREFHTIVYASYPELSKEVVKQMKIVSPNGITKEEKELYRIKIYEEVMNCARELMDNMYRCGIGPENPINRRKWNFLSAYSLDNDPNKQLHPRAGEAITSIWNDPCIERFMNHPGALYLRDWIPYFCQEAKQIASPDYFPRESDIVRCRTNTTGISETRISVDEIDIKMLELGATRGERRKWIHYFQNSRAITFAASLADYDRPLCEEETTTYLQMSLTVFESFVMSRWFKKCSIILLLVHAEQFRKKLGTSSLTKFFPEYSGDNDVDRAIKYIIQRFNQLNTSRLSVYPHIVETDVLSTIRPVFSTMKEIAQYGREYAIQDM